MLRAIHSLNWAAAKSHQRPQGHILHWTTEDIYIGYDSGAEVDRHLPKARDGGVLGRRVGGGRWRLSSVGGCCRHERVGREKRRRRDILGGGGGGGYL
jgi:hypothetical protein